MLSPEPRSEHEAAPGEGFFLTEAFQSQSFGVPKFGVTSYSVYQRIAPGWNGSKVLRVKLAGTVSAAAWLACISSSLPEKTASAIA